MKMLCYNHEGKNNFKVVSVIKESVNTFHDLAKAPELFLAEDVLATE